METTIVIVDSEGIMLPRSMEADRQKTVQRIGTGETE
jgi:hypothetical protein